MLKYLVKMGHLRESIEEAVSNGSQASPPMSSSPVIDTILAGSMTPKTQGQPRLGVFVVKVNYSFSPSSI